jgi:putative ABC transport system substrate-binding protein
MNVAMLTRRHVLLGSAAVAVGVLSGYAFGASLVGTSTRVRRVGVLNEGSAPTPSSPWWGIDVWRQQLAELGWIEGQNLIIDYRHANGSRERLPDLAADLVRAGVEVIYTSNTPEADAAKQATSTVPIVVSGSADPVRAGLVESLARPGRNITGISNFDIELNEKRIELLKECLPGLVRMAVLRNPQGRGTPMGDGHTEVTERSASRLGIEIIYGDMTEYGQIDETMARLMAQRPDALYVAPGPLFSPITAQVAELAIRERLPSMGSNSSPARRGLLMSYGGNDLDIRRRSAVMVGKILRGGDPAEMPIERPTTFDFVVNLKTAQALGLTIPEPLLRQATELIQ